MRMIDPPLVALAVLVALLEAALDLEGKTLMLPLERQLQHIFPTLFPYLSGRFTDQPRRDFRIASATACEARRAWHAAPRSAAEAARNYGAGRRPALGGHEVDRSPHRERLPRYAIVSPADLNAAAFKLTGDGASYNLGDTREKLLQTRLASV